MRIFTMNGLCRIVREHHPETGGYHIHCFAMHPEKFQSRKADKFDVDGIHPNIRPITSTPHIAWAYVTKSLNDPVHPSEMLCDEIPEEPKSKMKGSRPTNPVFESALLANSKNDFFNQIMTGDPRSFCMGFPSLSKAGDHLWPDVSTSNAPNATSGYWIQEWPLLTEFIGQSGIGLRRRDTDSSSEHTNQVTSCPSLVEGNTSTPRESSPQSLVGNSPYGSNPEWNEIFNPECYQPSWGHGEQPIEFDFNRYDGTPLPKTAVTKRPKSLILWGPSKTGKSEWARSLGYHVEFRAAFNLKKYSDDCEYAIFDDIKGGLRSWDNYKGWLGAQDTFEETDKYKGKKSIKWGRPTIYLANRDPLKQRGINIEKDWIRANCFIVHIDKPMCQHTKEIWDREGLWNQDQLDE